MRILCLECSKWYDSKIKTDRRMLCSDCLDHSHYKTETPEEILALRKESEKENE